MKKEAGNRKLRKNKQKTRQPGNGPSIIFLDTEFNATDNNSQNDGLQEITQIGAVAFRQGIPAKTFNRYCKIAPEHQITERSLGLTGISKELLDREGVPFIQAMQDLASFLQKERAAKIYAFGAADATELRNTAKWNNADADVYQVINQILNLQPIFASRLSLHFAYSLKDICKICMVDHETAHSAVQDAIDTGKAYYNMKAQRINKQVRAELEYRKTKIGKYRACRKVTAPQLSGSVSETTLAELEQAFFNAYTDPILAALYDDLMMAFGTPDKMFGEQKIR